MSKVDRHIDNCGVCGDGKGVCLQGYLMAVDERADNDEHADDLEEGR